MKKKRHRLCFPNTKATAMESMSATENLTGPVLKPLFPLFEKHMQGTPKIVREDLVDPKKNTCFLLHNVLTKEECKAIISGRPHNFSLQ